MKLFNGEFRVILSVNEFEVNRQYYKNILGLSEVVCNCNDFSEIHTCFHVSKENYLELVECNKSSRNGPTSLWFEAENINELYSVLMKHKTQLTILEDLSDRAYGVRALNLVDPDGNGNYFVTYIKDLRPYTKDAILGKYYKTEFRACFYVDDLDACFDFYHYGLELDVPYKWNFSHDDRGYKFDINGNGGFLEILHRNPLIPQGTGKIMIETTDIVDCYQHISAKRKISLLNKICTTNHGTMEFSLIDPDNNTIVIYQSIK